MEELISEKAAIVLDLLEKIESVNGMINLHSDDPFMKDQYIHRKSGFIKELVGQLGEFEIRPEDLAA